MAPANRFPDPTGKYPFVGPRFQKYGEQNGYVYDPYADNYVPDPRTQEEVLAAQGIKKEKPKGTDLGNVAAVAGVTAGATVVANKGGEALGGLLGGSKDTGNIIAGGTQGAEGVGSGVSSVPEAPNVLSVQSVNTGGEALNSTSGMNSTDIASSQAVSDAIANGATAQEAAAAGEAAGQAADAANGTNYFSAQKVATYVAMAIELYQGYQAATNEEGNKSDRGKEVGKRIGLAIADYWTGGAASGINALAMRTGFGRKLDKFVKDYSPGMQAWGMVGKNLLHKSTKGYQQQRLGELVDSGNQASAEFLAQGRQIADANNDTWQEGKYAGQKWDFEKALDLAKDDPRGFVGMYGNFQVAGDKWLTTPPEKQIEFVKRALAEGLYSSEKGDVLFSGKKGHLDRAKQIYAEVMGEQPAQPQAQQPTQQSAPQIGGLAGVGTAPQAQQSPTPATGGLLSVSNTPPPMKISGPQLPERDLPVYRPGDGPGTYRAPDGVNTILVNQNGEVSQTLIGVPDQEKAQQFLNSQNRGLLAV